MLQKETVSFELLERIKFLQKDDLFKNYYLAGGTALALQTGFRTSVDIDLFSFDKQDNELYINFFKDNFNEVKIDNNQPGILNMIIDDIKTDVCNIRGKIIGAPLREEGIVLFDIIDISAMKLSAICGRKRAKDYIDIAYLLSNKISLEKMFEYYMNKYQEKDIINIKKALAECNKVNPYEWEKVNIIDKKFFVSNVPGIIKEELSKYNKKHGIGKRKLFSRTGKFP
jgi:predicted nucleotidyltransferase component of viral defense system